jgi:hypothetical protein
MAWLHYQSGSAGDPADHCRDGLADVLFQPQYKPVQKWQEVLRGSNPALKKKAVVAIGRQLIVDLWRLETGRVTAQELNLVMIEAEGV